VAGQEKMVRPGSVAVYALAFHGAAVYEYVVLIQKFGQLAVLRLHLL
jgi:hypothetical protein